MSIMTVSRHLSNEFDQKSYKPGGKPCLTTDIKFNLLDFAKKYEGWTAEQLGRVLFSDESPVFSLRCALSM